MKTAEERGAWGQGVLLGFVALLTLSSCSAGGRRPGDDPVDSGDSETETEPLIEGEIPGWEMSWIVQGGGSVFVDGWPLDDRAISVAAMPDGSTYATGQFRGTAVFGEGEPNETVMEDVGGNYDGFVARYSPGGELVWARQLATPMDAYGFDVKVLGDGGGLVAGRTEEETTYFLGAPGETTLTTPAGWERGFFIARFGAEGELLWVAVGGHPEGESAVNGIAVLDDCTAVVAGNFQHHLITNPGTDSQQETESYGDHDIFVAGVSLEDGSIEWVEKAGSDSGPWEINSGIALAGDGSIVVAGGFGGSPLLGEGQPNETQLDAEAGVFLAKYDIYGYLESAWVAVEGNSEPSSGSVSATHDGDGFVIATGFSGTAILGIGTNNETTLTTAPGGAGVLLARYSSAGILEWVKHTEWTGIGDSTANIVNLSVSPEGRIAVGGSYTGEMVFGPGEPNETVLPKHTAAGDDLFLALFEPDGSLTWATSFNGGKPGSDTGDSVEFWGAHTIFFTGKFYGEMVFGTSAEDAVLLEASGSADMFLMRLDETDPPR